MRRRGVTLIEALLFGALAMILIAFAVGLQSRSFRLFGTAARTAALATDARASLENLVRGLRAAVLVTEPLSRVDWLRDGRLVYYRFASGDTRERLKANETGTAGRDYPFSADTGDETVWLVDCVRECWRLESGSLVVESAGGYLERRFVREEAPRYSFRPQESVAPASRRVLATHVTRFEATPVALMSDPSGPRGRRLALGDGSALRPAEIALVLLRLALEDRPADKPVAADEGQLEMATKVWLDSKSTEVRHPGRFSSLDEELEY